MQRLGIDYRIFVEPQDKGAYNFKNVIVLEQNDQGLGYSTGFAKKYAEEKGYDLVFRIDDDVKGIGQIENDMDKIIKSFDISKVGAVVFPYDFEWYAKSEKLFSKKKQALPNLLHN